MLALAHKIEDWPMYWQWHRWISVRLLTRALDVCYRSSFNYVLKSSLSSGSFGVPQTNINRSSGRTGNR